MKCPKWLRGLGRHGAVGASNAGGAPSRTPATSIEAELAEYQAKFPFPRWSLAGTSARQWILAGIPGGGVGAEVGVFRGHFSEVILSTLKPRKFFMIDPWTKLGEFFPWADEYTAFGKLPTALARREAQLRAAKFPGTQTVIIEEKFPACISQIDVLLDWIYIDSSHKYGETLQELKAAASILKPDGVIIGDDFYADRTAYHHGVFRAVNEFVKTAPYEFVAGGPNAQWLLRRTNIGAVAPMGQKSIDELLASNQARFPFPPRALADFPARQSLLIFAQGRSVGVEVGAFRGHFSEMLLGQLMPRKFTMLDAWTSAGEFYPQANEYTNNGKLPTRLARQEAEFRAAKFPNSETAVVDKRLREFVDESRAEPVDWVYLHCTYDYKANLVNLVAAAKIVKPGGVIMGDGYYPDNIDFHHGAYRAINEFLSATSYQCVSLGHAGQWCLRRPPLASGHAN